LRSVLVTVVLFVLGSTGVAIAQSPMASYALATPGGMSPQPKGAAANNPWLLGTQVAYKLAGEGDVSQNLLVSGRLIYEIPLNPKGSSGYHLPVMGNVATLVGDAVGGGTAQDSLDRATQALLSTGAGLNLGLYPYRVFHSSANLLGTVFGSAVAKVNTLADGAGTRHTLFMGRFSVGAEYAVGDSTKGHHMTFSLSGVVSVFSRARYQEIFGRNRSVLPSVESTLVLPVKDNVGALLEGVVAPDHVPTGRIGLIVCVEPK